MPVALNAASAAAGSAFGVLAAIEEKEGRSGQLESALQADKAEALARIGPALETVTALAVGWLLANQLSDVHLDPDKPFSDESMSAALSQVLGVPVASVKNRAALKAAVKAAITQKVSIGLGVPFEDIFDRVLARRDALRAVGKVANDQVPGLNLRDLSDKETTKADAEEFARLHLSDATGINFTNLRSIKAIKEDAYVFAMPYVREKLDAEETQNKYDRKKPLKMDRKHIRAREASRRFRAKHKGAETYRSVK